MEREEKLVDSFLGLCGVYDIEKHYAYESCRGAHEFSPMSVAAISPDRWWEFSPTLFFEHYETSGFGGEDANRFGAALGIRYNLTNSITLGLDYRFIWKDSNLEDADYYQNLAFLSLYYKF